MSDVNVLAAVWSIPDNRLFLCFDTAYAVAPNNCEIEINGFQVFNGTNWISPDDANPQGTNAMVCNVTTDTPITQYRFVAPEPGNELAGWPGGKTPLGAEGTVSQYNV